MPAKKIQTGTVFTSLHSTKLEKKYCGKKTESLKYYVFLKKKKKRLLGINFHTTSINKERDLEFQSSVLFLCACFMQCLTIIKDNSWIQLPNNKSGVNFTESLQISSDCVL